uniref:Uncharacterized protein n=1 Tax=viral metagenome TaxID=1070528 RepID=A0A6M3KYQ2_9ZZZZ
MQYPIFYESPYGYIAIYEKDRMMLIKKEGYAGGSGFELKIYKTRATVKKYETIPSYAQRLKPKEFYDKAQTYMLKYIDEVKRLTAKALPGSNAKMLTAKSL